MANGATPDQALEIMGKGDPERDYRQVGLVDAEGRTASYTGVRCFDWAGSLSGEGYSVQGNVLAGPQVPRAMADAFEPRFLS